MYIREHLYKGQYKFRTVVSEVSCFEGNPVSPTTLAINLMSEHLKDQRIHLL